MIAHQMVACAMGKREQVKCVDPVQWEVASGCQMGVTEVSLSKTFRKVGGWLHKSWGARGQAGGELSAELSRKEARVANEQ